MTPKRWPDPDLYEIVHGLIRPKKEQDVGYIRPIFVLVWKMRLLETGHTCFELREDVPEGEASRRWGWIINAADTGWTAHVGDWGQGEMVGRAQVPVPQEVKTFPNATVAKDWIEKTISDYWKCTK